MAEQLQLMLDGTAPAPVEKRKGYTREEKLKVVKLHDGREAEGCKVTRWKRS